MQYTIRRASAPLGNPGAGWDGPAWTDAETLEIANYRWEDSGHHPPTAARVIYDDDYLAIIYRVEDQYVRAVARKFQDGVCGDSCVEFFVAPVSGLDAYFNFEVNCGGTMLVRRMVAEDEKADGKENMPLTEQEWERIPMATSLPAIVDPEIAELTTWTVEYHLPLDLFESYFGISRPAPGTQWRANFYKCADRTSHPHWGSWAPVETATPSFHAPAFFQPLFFA